jgi:TonB-linked SusC/RagA family outer membrane protein
MRTRFRSRVLSAFGALVAALLLVVPNLGAQQGGTVTGRVVDSQTGEPVPAVQVFISTLDLGGLTQQNGRYLLQNVPAGTHTVTVARIGFRSIENQITVGGGQTVEQNFAMAEEALALDEIIVTGTAGGTQRRALGNSIEVLRASAITDLAPVTSMQDLMSARTPGLRFGGSVGQVGGGMGISIRGVSSVSLGSSPLIYVDGVRVESDTNVGPRTGLGQAGSSFNDLNPDDIESIEIVKGPAAATLYGTEASAGVIQIITKRGNVGAPQFEFEATGGQNFMADPQKILGTQYACNIVASQCPAANVEEVQLYDEAGSYLRGDGRFAGNGNSRSGNLFQNGLSQRYNMSVRGGTEQVRYYVAGTFQDQEGIVDYNTHKQTNVRANLTLILSEAVSMDVSTGYSSGKTRFATVQSEGGVWHQLVWGRPSNLPGVRTEAGRGFMGFQERFPEAYEGTDITREFIRFTGSVTTTHTYSDWFTQRLTVGVDRTNATNNNFIPGSSDFPRAPRGKLVIGTPIDDNFTFDWNASGTYQITDGLGTTTSVGARYYSAFSEAVTNTGAGFPTAVQTVISQTEFGDRQVSFSSIENKTLGFFVQEQLSWQDRIFLTAALSGDDNSAFGSDFALQYYPNFQGSWVLSEESFWNVDMVNSLRLRAAWGQAGRQPSTFASQTLYGTILGPNGNGLVPTTAGNPEVGPEVSTEWEAGVDLALFGDRLSGSVSVYSTVTSDLLVSQSLAPSTGLTGSRQANLGEMTNSGWEVSLDARLWESDNISFDLNLSGDYTTNEITKLGEDILPTGNYQLGWPYPNIATDFYLLEASMNEAGTSYDPASLMCDGGIPAVPGGPNIMLGGDPIPCGDYDEAGLLLGPSYPKYSFHIAPTVTLFQDLTLFALAEGQYGRWIASVDANYACRYYRSCLQSVIRTDPFFLAGTSGSGALDDRYNGRFQADFWKLRQFGARYNLPEDLVGKAGASRASLSVSANNLFMLWKKTDRDLSGNKLYDPEYASNSSTPSQTGLWELPAMASISATMRVTF